MVTVQDLNVHVYRTEGTSDEQASVLKHLFTDISFCDDNNLCSVNSINWFRIAVQSTYFVWAYLQIYGSEKCFGLPVNFCIPTGGGNMHLFFISFRLFYCYLVIILHAMFSFISLLNRIL
jgi:threonine synthase